MTVRPLFRCTLIASACILMLGWGSYSVAATAYTVDTAHSSLGFTATQSGAEFDGRFTDYHADIVFADNDLEHSHFDVTITMKSVSTGQDDRDDSLRDKDLFNASKFPTAHFIATRFTRKTPGQYLAAGKLTLRDVTHDVQLPFTFEGKSGAIDATLKGGVTLKRLDYGVGQGEMQDTSMVGNDVKVKFSLHLIPGSTASTSAVPAQSMSNNCKKTIPTSPSRSSAQ